MNLKREKPFTRRMLRQPHRYPHAYKIQRNLYGILAMATSLDAIEETLLERRKLPNKTGPIPSYPHPEGVVADYAQLLEEYLIETAVFVRGHDDFWKAKEGSGWSKVLTRKCGTSRYVKGDPGETDLTLRAACDKIIHHTQFDCGRSEDRFVVFLWGAKQSREWCAELQVEEFCWIGLTYVK